MQKVLIICGPTATGKSRLAQQLSHLYPADTISADSRQIYIGTDIVTGTDPTTTYGINLVNPNEQYSVSQWQKYALEKISHIQSQNRLPIVVGGTGLYIASLLKNLESIHIPPNPDLRQKLSDLSVAELFTKLNTLSPQKAQELNNSDRNNPRRLIRALEIATTIPTNLNHLPEFDTLQIGLTCDLSSAMKNISLRIDQRIASGAQIEYSTLIQKGFGEYLSNIASGYTYISDPQKWLTSELQLFRRQKTWFKKMPNIHWFDIDQVNTSEKVFQLVSEWYSKIN